MNRTFLCIFVIRITSGPRVKFVDSKNAPPVVDATDCYKTMAPVSLLYFVALWFLLRGVS